MSSFRVALLGLLGIGSPCVAQTVATFEWPHASAGALPDARLREILDAAKAAAREGADRALEGRQVAMQARVRTSVRGAIGLGGKPTTIADGTVMKALPYNNDSGPMLGTVTYPNGASMTGVFGPNVGVYHPSFTSTIGEFAGFCFAATTSNPTPMDGEYKFRSGDTFVGTRNVDEFEGVYESADHERKFIGIMLLNTASPRPVRGVVEDGHGHLLATINGGG